MEPVHYVKALRGRWFVVAIVLLVGLSAAWFTRTSAPPRPVRETTTYTARAVLLSSQNGRTTGLTSLSTLSELVRLDQVVRRTAENIGHTGDRKALSRRIDVSADQRTGFLTLSSTSRLAAEARRVADGFAETLVTFVDEQQRKTIAEDTESVNQELEKVKTTIDNLNDQLLTATDGRERALRSQLDQKVRERATLESELKQLTSTVTQAGDVSLIQPAVVERDDPLGPALPQGNLVRLLIGGLAGLILGVLLALGLERLDPRIRDSEAAERHFQVPLLARIPRIPRKERRSAPVSVMGASSSATADAFRLLAASILRWPLLTPELHIAHGHAGIRLEESPVADKRGARVLSIDKELTRPKHAFLITSAASGEGKTTVVANLAGAFAEMGKKTVVLSCDLRNPEVHELLGVENETGLVEALESSRTPLLNGTVLDSPLHETNIKVVPSGAPPPNPAELLNSDAMRNVIEEACRHADVVLIDTPPILAAMDVAMMVSEVDAVLVIARSGKTSVKVADGTSEMLNKLGAPFLGVVLNASTDIVKPRSYYRGVLPGRRSSSSALPDETKKRKKSEKSEKSEQSA